MSAAAGPGRLALAAAVRRLVHLTTSTEAGDDELRAVAAELDAVADRVAALAAVSASHSAAGGRRAQPAVEGPFSLSSVMPFDPVVGAANPLAPPVELVLDPPLVIGRAEFTGAFEGAPGCVHGAAIAGAFDLVLTGANVLHGAAGPTAWLTVRFRKPTLLGTPCEFSAEVVSVEGKRVTTTGRLRQHGEVTAEAEGMFIALDMDGIANMAKSRTTP